MELELSCAKEPELAVEVPVSEQFHGFQDAPQARGRDDMDDGAVVPGDGDKRAGLGGADGGRGLALEVLDTVCILHKEKMYI